MSRVLCFIDSLASGGAERQMSYLVSGLQKAGNQVTLVVFSAENAFYRDRIERSGAELVFDTKGFNKFRRVFRIRKWVKRIKPDAVIAYKDGVTMGACLARMLTRFNLIVSERNTTQYLSKRERLKFFLYRRATHIVPNNFSQARFIENNYPNLSAKVSVITNVLDTKTFTRIDGKCKAEPIVVVTTARVMAQKNVLRYLDAVAIVKSRGGKMKFRWYGNQSDDYFSLVKKRVKDLNIGDIIDFYPPEKQVTEVYSSAHIFCLPSIYEGFPNVVCEAMSCKLPIICGNVCDNPDIVTEGVNGFLFDPNDENAIADAIERMVSLSDKERASIGEVNRRKIEQLCSEDTFIAKYTELFR